MPKQNQKIENYITLIQIKKAKGDKIGESIELSWREGKGSKIVLKNYL